MVADELLFTTIGIFYPSLDLILFCLLFVAWIIVLKNDFFMSSYARSCKATLVN